MLHVRMSASILRRLPARFTHIDDNVGESWLWPAMFQLWGRADKCEESGMSRPSRGIFGGAFSVNPRARFLESEPGSLNRAR